MLAAIQEWCLILAQRERWERLGDRFSRDADSSSAAELLSTIGPAAAVILLLLIAHRWWNRPGRRVNSSSRLFTELCQAHAIGLRGRRLLKQLARSRRLASPALLFVTPDGFEPASLPEDLRPQAKEIAQLRDRLFLGLPLD